MGERLVVRNFGPITNLDIEIKRLTIFIGTQGSGKSTISKLLTICRDVKWYLQILNNEEVYKPFKSFCIDQYFQESSYFHYEGQLGKVTYENNTFKVEIDGCTELAARVYLLTLIQNANQKFLKEKEKTNSSLADEKALDANSRLMLYIPAERNLIGNLSSALASIMLAKIPLSDTILEYMSLFEKSKKEYPLYDIPFLGVNFEVKDGKERIVIKDSGKDLPLNACSSGLQSVLPMIMVIDYARKNECFDAFVIEEPEQNLFPENQCELLSFITSKQTGSTPTQFVITTHSPYLLAYLNDLMLAFKLYQQKDWQEKVVEIISPESLVDPSMVAVYGLEPNTPSSYCTNLIAERTGLISINALDSASEFIGEKYEALYQMYLKSKRS